MGHFEIVNMLLVAKADPNARNQYSKQTALWIAASRNHVEVVWHLLDEKLIHQYQIQGDLLL